MAGGGGCSCCCSAEWQDRSLLVEEHRSAGEVSEDRVNVFREALMEPQRLHQNRYNGEMTYRMRYGK